MEKRGKRAKVPLVHALHILMVIKSYIFYPEMFRPEVQNKQGTANSDEDVHRGDASVRTTGKSRRFRSGARGFREIWYSSVFGFMHDDYWRNARRSEFDYHMSNNTFYLFAKPWRLLMLAMIWSWLRKYYVYIAGIVDSHKKL